jgi:hypothetical protein
MAAVIADAPEGLLAAAVLVRLYLPAGELIVKEVPSARTYGSSCSPASIGLLGPARASVQFRCVPL